MRQILFYDIEWDTDGEDLDLPESVEVETDTFESESDIQNDGADFLSDRFGYCVNGFQFKLIAS